MQNCNCYECINGASIGKCGWFCRLTKSKLFKLALIVAFPIVGSLYSVVDAIQSDTNSGGAGGGGSTPPDELANANRMQLKTINKQPMRLPTIY
jgi:hypothetical protein